MQVIVHDLKRQDSYSWRLPGTESRQVHGKSKIFLIFKKNFRLLAGGAQVEEWAVFPENEFALAFRIMERQRARGFVALCFHGGKDKPD